jgi:hypothetical protein
MPPVASAAGSCPPAAKPNEEPLRLPSGRHHHEERHRPQAANLPAPAAPPPHHSEPPSSPPELGLPSPPKRSAPSVQPPDPAKAPLDPAAPPPAATGTACAGSPPHRARAAAPVPTLRARGKKGPAAAFLAAAWDPGGPLRRRRGGGRGRWWRRLGLRERPPVTHAGETSRPPPDPSGSLKLLVVDRYERSYHLVVSRDRTTQRALVYK